MGQGRKKVLIDTGGGVKEYIEDLAAAAEEIECIIITHFHGDHVGGVADVLQRFGAVPVYKFKVEGDDESFLHVKEGDVIEGGGCRIRVIETPGHSHDSISLFLEQENAVFTGDIVLGTGSTLLDDYSVYLQSMEKLISIRAEVIYSAHGTPRTSPEKLTQDLQHRKDREGQVMKVLSGEMSTFDIMKAVYGEIHEALIPPALKNTNLYLKHLKKLGLVTENNEKWTVV